MGSSERLSDDFRKQKGRQPDVRSGRIVDSASRQKRFIAHTYVGKVPQGPVLSPASLQEDP